jgi:hypothetical protein
MPFPNIEDAFREVKAKLQKQTVALQALEQKNRDLSWSPRQLWRGQFAKDRNTNLLFWGIFGFWAANLFDRPDFLSDDLAWFGLLFLGVWYQIAPLPETQAAKNWDEFYRTQASLQDMFRDYFFPNYEFVPTPNLQMIRRNNPFLDNSYKKKPPIVFHNHQKELALILHEHILDPNVFCLSIFWMRKSPFSEKPVSIFSKDLMIPRHPSVEALPIQNLSYFPNIAHKFVLRSESRAQTAVLVQRQEAFLLEFKKKTKHFYLKVDSETLLITFFNVRPELFEQETEALNDSESNMNRYYTNYLYLYEMVNEIEQAFKISGSGSI